MQSTLLRPSFSGGPKGWNSGFDETHDIHNFFSTFIRTLDRYPWLLHFGFSHMITCFKVLVLNVKDDNKSKTSKVKILFFGGVPKRGFSSISGFSYGLGPQFWSISARSSAKANGAKHSPPSLFLRWPKGPKSRIWRNTWYSQFLFDFYPHFR